MRTFLLSFGGIPTLSVAPAIALTVPNGEAYNLGTLRYTSGLLFCSLQPPFNGMGLMFFRAGRGGVWVTGLAALPPRYSAL